MDSDPFTPPPLTIKDGLEYLLSDLHCEHLDVILVPAPSPQHQEHYIRVAVERNPEWYRILCELYPDTRKGRCSTTIRRATIIGVLERLIDKGKSVSKHAQYLIETASKRVEIEQERINAAKLVNFEEETSNPTGALDDDEYELLYGNELPF